MGEGRRVMPRDQRDAWLIARIREERAVDVLNADFVRDYADHTGALYRFSMIGAGWCDLLPQDLLRLKKYGWLKRHRTGLAGNWQPGFPKWVWSYRLAVPEGSSPWQEWVAARSDADAQGIYRPTPSKDKADG